MLLCQTALPLKAICLALCLTSTVAVTATFRIEYAGATHRYEANPARDTFECRNVADFFPNRRLTAFEAALNFNSIQCRVSV